MDEFHSQIESFFLRAVEQMAPINIDSFPKGFPTEAEKSHPVQPLFLLSSSPIKLFSSQIAPRSPFATEPESDYPIVSNSCSSDCTSSVTREPQSTHFVYPSKEQILTELQPESCLSTQLRSTHLPDDNVHTCFRLTQEFEESMSQFNLTQLLDFTDDHPFNPTGPHIPSVAESSQTSCPKLISSLSAATPLNEISTTTVLDSCIIASARPCALQADFECASATRVPTFVTAGGRRISSPKSEALLKARSLFSDVLEDECATSSTEANAGLHVSMAETPLFSAPQAAIGPASATGMPAFVTAGGRRISSPKSEALLKARSLLPDVHEGKCVSNLASTTTEIGAFNDWHMFPTEIENSAPSIRSHHSLFQESSDSSLISLANEISILETPLGMRLAYPEKEITLIQGTHMNLHPSSNRGVQYLNQSTLSKSNITEDNPPLATNLSVLSGDAVNLNSSHPTSTHGGNVVDPSHDESSWKASYIAEEISICTSKDSTRQTQPDRYVLTGFNQTSGPPLHPSSTAGLEHSKQLCETDGDALVSPLDSHTETTERIAVFGEKLDFTGSPLTHHVLSMVTYSGFEAGPTSFQNSDAPTSVPLPQNEGPNESRSPGSLVNEGSVHEFLIGNEKFASDPDLDCVPTSPRSPEFPNVSKLSTEIVLGVDEPDSLNLLMEDSQFQESAPTLLWNHGLAKTDRSLEAKREDLRVHQRNLVTEKKLLHVPGSDKNDLKRSEIPGVRSPGKLWRLRLACRQAAPGKQLLRPLHTLLLPSLRNTSVSKTTYCLPDFLYLAADASRWSLSTSSQLRWLLDAAVHGDQSGPSNSPVYYELGDGAVLIPDAYGCVGKEEISRAFLAMHGVSCQVASSSWVSHHYDQIAWKLGSTAIRWHSFNDATVSLPDDYFSPHHVLLRLKYRYDRELDSAERSALRKIIELDDTPARRLVLCVSALSLQSNAQIQLRLTDGWYHINCLLDESLGRLIRSGRVRVGSKLVTAGAELVQLDACTGTATFARTVKQSNVDATHGHLFGSDGAAMGVFLRLHGNSTRPAPWYSRLGFSFSQPSSGCGLHPVPLCTLAPDGGLCSAIRVVVQRRYPLQYMETLTSSAGSPNSKLLGSKRHVFRSERAEQAEIARNETERRNALDRALDHLTAGIPGQQRTQPTRAQLLAMGNDGEALYSAITNALDPAEVEMDLTDTQRESIRHYKEAALQLALSEAAPNRTVTRLLRVRVSGLHPRDVALNYVVPLTFWNPSDDLLALLKEGEPIELYKLQASTTRSSDPFAPPRPFSGLPSTQKQQQGLQPGSVLSLSGGRNVSIRVLKSTSNQETSCTADSSGSITTELLSKVYQPRRALSVYDVQRLYAIPSGSRETNSDYQNLQIELDLRCLVVAVHESSEFVPSLRTRSDPKISADRSTTSLAPTTSHGAKPDAVYVTDSDASTGGLLLVIKIWGGIKSQQLSGVLQKGHVVHFTDLQLRQRQHFTRTPVLDPELGTISEPLVALTYTMASNVTVEKTRSAPLVLARHSSDGLPSAQKSAALSHLEHLAEIHWYANSPSRSAPVPRSSPQCRLQKRSPMQTLSSFTNRIGFGLSALLQSANSPGAPLTYKSPDCPKEANVSGRVLASVSIDPFSSVNDQSTPLRSMITRSAPRTGLSRRGRSRANATSVYSLNTSRAVSAKETGTTSDCNLTNSTPLTAYTREPMKQALLPLSSTDQLTATPEPKAKRRRMVSESPCPVHDCYLEDKENSRALQNSSQFAQQIASKSPPSPVCAGGTLLSSPTSSCSALTPASSTSPTTPHDCDSSEDLNVSIADLVKTRRRRASDIFHTSSTPTRRHYPRSPMR